MATKKETAEYIMEQAQGAGEIAIRKMFGEYALYCDTKIVAFICDDRLFVKPNAAAKIFLGDVEEAPPYPGAKNYYLISEERWDDAEYIAELVRISADALPLPKAKTKKNK